MCIDAKDGASFDHQDVAKKDAAHSSTTILNGPRPSELRNATELGELGEQGAAMRTMQPACVTASTAAEQKSVEEVGLGDDHSLLAEELRSFEVSDLGDGRSFKTHAARARSCVPRSR